MALPSPCQVCLPPSHALSAQTLKAAILIPLPLQAGLSAPHVPLYVQACEGTSYCMNGSTQVSMCLQPGSSLVTPTPPHPTHHTRTHQAWARASLRSTVTHPVQEPHLGQTRHWLRWQHCVPSCKTLRQNGLSPGFEARQPWVRILTSVLGTWKRAPISLPVSSPEQWGYLPQEAMVRWSMASRELCSGPGSWLSSRLWSQGFWKSRFLQSQQVRKGLPGWGGQGGAAPPTCFRAEIRQWGHGGLGSCLP